LFPLLDIPTFLLVLGPLLKNGFLGLALSAFFGTIALSGFFESLTVFGITVWGSCSLNIKNILSFNTLIVLNMIVHRLYIQHFKNL